MPIDSVAGAPDKWPVPVTRFDAEQGAYITHLHPGASAGAPEPEPYCWVFVHRESGGHAIAWNTPGYRDALQHRGDPAFEEIPLYRAAALPVSGDGTREATGTNATCPACEAEPREIVPHTDDAGVKSWTLGSHCTSCLLASVDGFAPDDELAEARAALSPAETRTATPVTLEAMTAAADYLETLPNGKSRGYYEAQLRLLAHRSPSAEIPTEAREVWWLIERRPHTPPVYWAGLDARADLGDWTVDANKARKFATKAEADSAINDDTIWSTSHGIATEHVFLPHPSVATAPRTGEPVDAAALAAFPPLPNTSRMAGDPIPPSAPREGTRDTEVTDA